MIIINLKGEKHLLMIFDFFFRRRVPKTFAFDHCFNSVDINDNNYASQVGLLLKKALNHSISYLPLA